MAQIINNGKLPWPSHLADFSYNCVKWGLLIAAIGILLALVLSSMVFRHFGEIIGCIFFVIGLVSFTVAFLSSSIALLGMLFYRFKIYGAGRAFGVFVLTFCGSSIGYALVQPALIKAKSAAGEIKCRSNMAKLSAALSSYMEIQGLGESKNNWCDVLLKECDVERKQMWCPCIKSDGCSYAINENIPPDANKLPNNMVLLFESSPGWNQFGGTDDVATDRHDRPGANIAFANGKVEFIKTQDIPSLRWTIGK